MATRIGWGTRKPNRETEGGSTRDPAGRSRTNLDPGVGPVPCRACGKPCTPHVEDRTKPVACSVACFNRAPTVPADLPCARAGCGHHLAGHAATGACGDGGCDCHEAVAPPELAGQVVEVRAGLLALCVCGHEGHAHAWDVVEGGAVLRGCAWCACPIFRAGAVSP